MSLVNAIDLVRQADARGAAVLSFVCIDYNEARAVISAAEQTGKPAIIMLLPEYVTKYSLNGFGEFAAMVRFMAEHTDARIGLHLDHSYDEAEVRWAIECGFTSVMFDASRDDLETNIRRTRAVVDYAHARGVAVESELGSVGLASERWGERTDLFTKPDAAALFCRETGVDSLAVAIGNAHGDYLQTPRLDLGRLDEIDAATDTPLVLHGGSGIPEDQLVEAFSRGINKFNYGTDIKRCYIQAIHDYMAKHDPPESLDVLGIPAAVQEAMTGLIARKLSLSRL